MVAGDCLLEHRQGGELAGAIIGRVGVEHLVNGLGVALALDQDAVDQADAVARGVLQAVEGVLADQQRRGVVLGHAFEARGEVDRVADHRAVHAVEAADGAEHDHAGVEADADLHRVVAGAGATDVVDVELGQHVDGGESGRRRRTWGTAP